MHLKVTFGNELLQTRVSPLKDASDSSHADNSSSNAFASFRSSVSKPSVNQP